MRTVIGPGNLRGLYICTASLTVLLVVPHVYTDARTPDQHLARLGLRLPNQSVDFRRLRCCLLSLRLRAIFSSLQNPVPISSGGHLPHFQDILVGGTAFGMAFLGCVNHARQDHMVCLSACESILGFV